MTERRRWKFEFGEQICLQTDSQNAQDWYLVNGALGENDKPSYRLAVSPTRVGVLAALERVGAEPWVDKESVLKALMPLISLVLFNVPRYNVPIIDTTTFSDQTR